MIREGIIVYSGRRCVRVDTASQGASKTGGLSGLLMV
jgi:hypothetical protein